MTQREGELDLKIESALTPGEIILEIGVLQEVRQKEVQDQL